MAGLGVYARKTWQKYRKDAEDAKAKKRKEKSRTRPKNISIETNVGILMKKKSFF